MRMLKFLLIYTFCLLVVICSLLTISHNKNMQSDKQIKMIDEFISSQKHYTSEEKELETVGLSYDDWKLSKKSKEQETDLDVTDVWTLGVKYGISELDTTRTLKLITYEGYGNSPLSYYVACCCWVRATENYWGYSDLYRAFGEADESYTEWLDSVEIADFAYDALEQCYKNPSYVKYCNGMTIPDSWVYEENGIYVW